MKDLVTMENELVTLEANPAVIFVHGGLTPLLAAISEKTEAMVKDLDPETPQGRAGFGTVCRLISSSKVFVEAAAKEYGAELRAKLKPIDGERIRWVKEMDALKAERDAPRREWQRREDEKIAAANDVMKSLTTSTVIYSGTTSAELAKRIEDVEAIDVSGLPEDYIVNAEKLQVDALRILYAEHAALVKGEEMRAELEKLRAEAAERARIDEENRIAREREERDKKIVEEAIKRAREETERREAILIAEKEAAERRIEEEKQRAKEEAEEAKAAQERAVQEAARKAKEEAEMVERERLFKEVAERKEAERRAANKKHCDRIYKEAAKGIIGVLGVTKEQADGVIEKIAAGGVPHVMIEY